MGATSAINDVRSSIHSLITTTAMAISFLRDFNDELSRIHVNADVAAAAIRRAADEQERLRNASGSSSGAGGDNDSSWRRHGATIHHVTQQYSGLAARLLATKSAMAVLSASVVGLIPVLTQLAGVFGMAFGTALSTAHVAAMSKELDHLSQTTHASAQALQEWRLAGRFTGIEAEMGELGGVGDIFTALNEKMESLGADKGGDFANELARIGLNAQEIKRLKPEEGLVRIGEALEKTKWTTEVKSKFLDDIAGDASKLLPLLTQNSAYFKEIKGYANAVGAIQSDEQLAAMKQTNQALSFFKLGLEGVQTQLSAVGANVVNTLAPNIKRLFVDARTPIAQWSSEVDVALRKFKTDLDATGSWEMAIKLSLRDAYPTLYGFVASAADFGRGYGEAFVAPMLNTLKRAYSSIRESLGNAGGAEQLGAAIGSAMLPITGIVDSVAGAIKVLIDNWSTLQSVAAFTPVGFVVAHWDIVTDALNAAGESMKRVAEFFGLLSPETQKSATGMQILTAALLGLVAASASTKLALGAIGAAFSVVKFAVGPAISAIGLIGSALLSLPALAPIAAQIGGVTTAIRAMSMVVLTNPITAAIAAIAAAGYLIYRNWGGISAFAAQTWASVKNSVSSAWGSITKTVSSSNTGKQIADLWSEVTTTFTPIVNNYLNLQKAMWSGAARMATEAMTAIATVVSSGWVAVQQLFASYAPAIRSAFSSVWAGLDEVVSGAWQSIKAVIGAGWDAVRGILTAGLRLLRGDFAGAWDAIIETAHSLGQRLKDFFAGLPATMMGYGRDIVMGLARGMADAAGAAVAEARAMAGRVAGSITGFFDIHSPSRLMHGYGANVTDGFGLGIQSRAAAVVSDAKSLAKSLFNALKIPTVTNNVDAQVQQLTGAKGDTEKVDKSSAGKNEATKGNNPAAQVADMNKIGAAYKKAADARGALTKAQVAGVSALDKEIQLISQSIESQGMAGWFSEQTNSMAQYSREAFEISKTAALAQAAINAPAAISAAFSWGSQHGGLPMGLAMGAAAAAHQYAQIRAIASQSFGGGSSGSSSGGGSSATATTDTATTSSSSSTSTQGAGGSVMIALEGGDNTRYTKKQIRDLIKQINDAVGDGARLAVA